MASPAAPLHDRLWAPLCSLLPPMRASLPYPRHQTHCLTQIKLIVVYSRHAHQLCALCVRLRPALRLAPLSAVLPTTPQCPQKSVCGRSPSGLRPSRSRINSGNPLVNMFVKYTDYAKPNPPLSRQFGCTSGGTLDANLETKRVAAIFPVPTNGRPRHQEVQPLCAPSS